MAGFEEPDEAAGELLNAYGNPVAQTDIQAMFESIDTNDDQRISKKELAAFFTENQVEDVDYMEVFKALDERGNKMVSFDDFESYIYNIPPSHTNVWSSIFSAAYLEFEPNESDYNIDYVGACKTRTRDWKGRIEAMEAFCRIILETATDEKSFQKKFRPMKEPLLTQLGDRRSIPVGKCCAVLAKLALNRRNWLYKYSKRVLTVLFEVVRLNVEIMSNHGDQCCRAWISSMDDRKCEIVNLLKELVRSKHEKVKVRATEYVIIQIQKTDPENKRYKKWWDVCLTMLKDCTNNATAKVRTNALKGLALIHAMKKKEVDKITKKFTSTLKKKWKKILDETYTSGEKQRKRVKSIRIPTSVNIKRQMIQAGIIDADPNDPDVADLADTASVGTADTDFDGADDSDISSSVSFAPQKREYNLKAPSSSNMRRRRKSTNKSRDIIELEMELQRVYAQVTSLQQQSATLKATQITVQRLTTANQTLMRENEEVRNHAAEMQETLSGVQDILDQFDELQEECDILHRELASKNASLETAINMIQTKEADLDILTQENIELGEMCTQLLNMLEETGSASSIDQASLSPRQKQFFEKKQTPETPPSKHAQIRDQMMRRLSTARSFQRPKKSLDETPAISKKNILRNIQEKTKSRLELNRKNSASMDNSMGLGGIQEAGEEDDMMTSPSAGLIPSELAFEKIRSASRGAFDPDSLDLDPETLLTPPDPDMLAATRGRHKRRDTATHRKRITRGQSFFKKLLDQQNDSPAGGDDDTSVWEAEG